MIVEESHTFHSLPSLSFSICIWFNYSLIHLIQSQRCNVSLLGFRNSACTHTEAFYYLVMLSKCDCFCSLLGKRFKCKISLVNMKYELKWLQYNVNTGLTKYFKTRNRNLISIKKYNLYFFSHEYTLLSLLLLHKQIEVCLFFDCKNRGNKEAQCVSLCLPLLPFYVYSRYKWLQFP